MTITLELYQLKDIIRETAEVAAKEAIMQAGLLDRYLTQSSAYKLYGRRVVDGWIRDGKVSARKNGAGNSRIFIDRLELDAMAKATDLRVYFRPAA